MASKSKSSFDNAQPEHRWDDGARPVEMSGRSATRHLVSRIAQALQIPETVFYKAPDAVEPRFESSGSCDGLDIECAALLQAYRRIPDPVNRQRLLSLVQKAAS